MSRSFRDKERIYSKVNHKDMNKAFSEGSPDIAEKVETCRKAKKVYRFGNKRKSMALLKKQVRRSERRENNNFCIEID